MKRLFNLAAACLLGLPFITGCISHTHQVQQAKSAGPALNQGVAQLIAGVNERYAAIQTVTATVSFSAQTGGEKTGKVKDYNINFGGHILLRKPDSLRVLGLVPVIGTRAFDLASDGTNFKLYIPPKNKAIVGPTAITEKSANGIENLRPNVFIDSILVRNIEPEKLVYLTTGSDTQTVGKQLVETPLYDLNVMMATPEDEVKAPARVIQEQRVIHFDRTTLLPNGQDLYNASGALETKVRYGPYQHFGNALFPAVITIDRPLEEYKITITIQHLILNQTLNDQQFELTIPPNVPTQILK